VASTLDTVTVDCADPRRLADFWAASLAWVVADADDDGAFIRPPEGGHDGASGDAGAARRTGLFFQKVPEPKTVKNRVHLDLRPPDSMAAEVERSKALGATVQERVDVEGSFWTVMLDPEGNEFCILRGPRDGWSAEG
jgi:predicted enzyme related to lactoylglutathione lyase